MPPAAKNGMADAMPFFLRREPLRWVLVGKKRSSLQRTHCTLSARNAHVFEPKGIFSAVHAAGENDWIFFCRAIREPLRDFWIIYPSRGSAPALPGMRSKASIGGR